jgi:HlyD family type I secretion membrane fusion protein
MAKKSRVQREFTGIDVSNDWSVKFRVVLGFFTALFLVVVLGGWAATSQLSGAVIAQGLVKVDKDLRAVQHLDGGIIRTINVKKGDAVQERQVLFTLNDTQMNAELQIVRSQLVELLAQRQRLFAERDQLSDVQPVAGFEELKVSESAAFQGELRIFKGNLIDKSNKTDQLKLGLSQLDEEINGLTAQSKSNEEEFVLVKAEADKVKKLLKKGLVEGTRNFANSRDLTRLEGENAQIQANIARSKSRRSELELQILAIDETYRNDAQKRISEIEPRITELLERKSAIADRLTRLEIRSPIAGTVNEVSINTIGGIITPAQKLLTIVPDHANLQIEVKLQPSDIDQVYVSQHAKLRFSAFSAQETPELDGTVEFVSPATSTDPSTGMIYYTAQVVVPDAEILKLKGKKLVPGMPVESFLQTESRTALSYLAKPFADQIKRAFREQ